MRRLWFHIRHEKQQVAFLHSEWQHCFLWGHSHQKKKLKRASLRSVCWNAGNHFYTQHSAFPILCLVWKCLKAGSVPHHKTFNTKRMFTSTGGSRFIRMCLNRKRPFSQEFSKQSLLCYSVRLIQNSPESKDFYWVLFVRISWNLLTHLSSFFQKFYIIHLGGTGGKVSAFKSPQSVFSQASSTMRKTSAWN